MIYFLTGKSAHMSNRISRVSKVTKALKFTLDDDEGRLKKDTQCLLLTRNLEC